MSLIYNILLAMAWTTMTGDLTVGNGIFGFLLGYIVLLICRRGRAQQREYIRKTLAVLHLALYFVWELILSNLRLAIDVMRIRIKARPGIVAIPLDVTTDAEITLLANLITLTPGTLSMDVSDDRSTLYVHAMFADDPQALRDGIKQQFERLVMEALR
jgi:multicomponent Na+:H+ antiporter subunit E